MAEIRDIHADTGPAAAIADAVCPHCFRLLTSPFLADQGKDSYNRELRTYYGWCFECKLGAMVIQFFRDGRWIIHKYQNYELFDTLNLCRPSGDWVKVNEIPEPAPVVTGPGGDFTQSHEPAKVDLLDLLKSLKTSLEKTSAVIGKYLNG